MFLHNCSQSIHRRRKLTPDPKDPSFSAVVAQGICDNVLSEVQRASGGKGCGCDLGCVSAAAVVDCCVVGYFAADYLVTAEYVCCCCCDRCCELLVLLLLFVKCVKCNGVVWTALGDAAQQVHLKNKLN